jgi:chemotaxis protein histidine kinase CheA
MAKHAEIDGIVGIKKIEAENDRLKEQLEEAKPKIEEGHAKTQMWQDWQKANPQATPDEKLKQATKIFSPAAAAAQTRADTADKNSDAKINAKKAGAQQTDKIVSQIDSLDKLVDEHPEVVSTVGAVTRAGETVQGWLKGRGAPTQLTPATDFAAKMTALQQEVSQALSGSKYYSKARQDQMQTILPGLGKFTSPDEVHNTLRSMKTILENSKLDADYELSNSPVIIQNDAGEKMMLDRETNTWQPMPGQ